MNEKVDIKQTLTCMVPMIFSVSLIVLYVASFVHMIEMINSEEMEVICFIVFAFSLVKLVSWIHVPDIIYKSVDD